MLTIDRLRLTLPPGFEHRAGALSWVVAQELAALRLPGSRTLDHLAVPRVTVPLTGSDRDIGGHIARAIHRELTSGGE